MILIAAAVLATGIMWYGFVLSVINNPSPPRFVDVVVEGEVLDDGYRLSCIDPSYSIGGTIWRNCLFAIEQDGGEATTNAMVRYDLENGLAEVNWQFVGIDTPEPLPGFTENVALVALPDDSLVIVKETRQIYHLLPEGGVEVLSPFVPEERSFGLEYLENSNQLEMVTVNAQQWLENPPITLHTFSPEGGESTSRELPPLDCEQTDTCRLEFAYREGDVWQLVFVRIAESAIDPAEAARDTIAAEVFIRPEGGEAVNTGRIELRIIDHYLFSDEDDFLWLDEPVLAPVAGNVITWAFEGPPYEWINENWVPLEMPFGDILGDVRPLYEVLASDLAWMPVVEASPPGLSASYSQRLGDNTWVAISGRGEATGLKITNTATEVTQVVSGRDARFTTLGDYALFPSADGGYWFQEDESRYVQLDAQFQRQDALSFNERLARLFGAYHTSDPIARFYEEDGWLKQASVPLMLLLVPLGFAIVAVVVRLTRIEGAGFMPRFIRWAGAVSLIYLLLVLFINSEYTAVINQF